MDIIVLLIAIIIYFIPFIIAVVRKVRNQISVFFLNLFLGWTVIGFFVLIFYASLTNATSNVSVVDWVKSKGKKNWYDANIDRVWNAGLSGDKWARGEGGRLSMVQSDREWARYKKRWGCEDKY